ncbi:hypothetical protein BDK51DRAFT_44225 [Blyttiomyces helicus]|uniref:Uncharacterized protein n=1 Tax=Blyttiomyces helicus TaxID=388810 RepID=A0A4P9VZZ8_9FUNG|nr:hypothetical protein BDK51DRAFT_44225 [Blyttiomyces helicus]|eukprot:RKO85431.1 hypothetical protein BDK51DRAFT_44225 [Blyttiomyces helicus]
MLSTPARLPDSPWVSDLPPAESHTARRPRVPSTAGESSQLWFLGTAFERPLPTPATLSTRADASRAPGRYLLAENADHLPEQNPFADLEPWPVEAASYAVRLHSPTWTGLDLDRIARCLRLSRPPDASLH